MRARIPTLVSVWRSHVAPGLLKEKILDILKSELSKKTGPIKSCLIQPSQHGGWPK